MQETWHLHRPDPQRARTLADAVDVHPLTAQLLLNRGVETPAAAAGFLQPSLRGLDGSTALPNLDQALERIAHAIARREAIVIFGDSDVDGLTASVILYETLERLDANVRALQSNRITDGYGLPETVIQQICASAAALVILVDCGTNQPDAIRQLTASGIDTIIVDHHVPLDGWAEPLALINPHCNRDAASRELCSAGLAFKFAQALLGDGAQAAAFLDLAALGTLADCAPLRGENRTIAALGLPRIIQSERRGLRCLCEATRTGEPDPEQVIRRLVPRLNASGRLGDASAVWRLLRRSDDGPRQEWIAKVDAAHAITKKFHRQMIAQAQEQVNRFHFKDQYVMVVSRAGWHQGLMGPLASQLSQRYGRPAIALAMNGSQATGSGRSIPSLDLLNLLKGCQEHLVRFGGHAQACGLTIDQRHLDRFRSLVNEQAKQVLGREGLVKSRWVDLELSLGALQPRWVEEIERFTPFGQGNPRPTVILRGVAIEERSPRTATVCDGSVRVAAKGRLPLLAAGERYDLVANPMLLGRELALSLVDVKGAAGLSEHGRI